MSGGVRIADSAEHDLENIANYISFDGPTRAARFVQDILDHCLQLGEFPNRHGVIVGYSRPLRRFPFRGYSIYYLADDGLVEIVHVLNDAQDHRKILAN